MRTSVGTLSNLHHSVNAAESTFFLAKQLQTCRTIANNILPNKLAKEMENYFQKSLEVSEDLKHSILGRVTRRMLQVHIQSSGELTFEVLAHDMCSTLNVNP